MRRSLSLDQPALPSRRRFLKGAAAATAAGAVLPTWMAKAAMAATSPVGPDEGMVVVVLLRGGNDAFNTVVPLTGKQRSTYDAVRGALAIPGAQALPQLAKRAAQGKVAVIQGIGRPTPTLSHFDSIPAVLAGSPADDLATGWIGRYLDGLPGWDTGLSGLSVTSIPRLDLVGSRVEVTAMPSTQLLWAPATISWDIAAQDAVRELGAASTGLGPLADTAAAVGVTALDVAKPISAIYPATPPAAPFLRDLDLAARALNCNMGTRAVALDLWGWDTHALQTAAHANLLSQLDAAIEHFWATLAPSLASRTCMVVISEFGRRPAPNASLGTDHGTAGVAMVIGDQVRGGVTGAAPSLTALDADGNPSATVDFRSLYATVLERWLGADADEVLGASYPRLDVFAAGPGARQAAA
jgi:uncharacterized protein (DUF1501 family)